jgi:hypothetical protein
MSKPYFPNTPRRDRFRMGSILGGADLRANGLGAGQADRVSGDLPSSRKSEIPWPPAKNCDPPYKNLRGSKG